MNESEPDAFVAMALLSGTGASLKDSFERFARLASQSWPDLVSVERSGFFSCGPVHKIVVRLPGRAYIARQEGPGLVCEIGAMARGVVIRVDIVTLAEWCESLRRDVEQITAGSFDAQRFLDAGIFPDDGKGM